jgi:hypothetical protein
MGQPEGHSCPMITIITDIEKFFKRKMKEGEKND